LFASGCFWYILSNWSIDKPLSHSGLFSIQLTVFILFPFEYPFFSRTGHNVNSQTVCILGVFVCSQMPKRGRSRVRKKMMDGGSERVSVAVKFVGKTSGSYMGLVISHPYQNCYSLYMPTRNIWGYNHE
jgi:hypothetical protein